jgi:hypothetical protein
MGSIARKHPRDFIGVVNSALPRQDSNPQPRDRNATKCQPRQEIEDVTKSPSGPCGTRSGRGTLQPPSGIIAALSRRHSTIELTMRNYTKVNLYDVAGAVEKLPDLSPPAQEGRAEAG